MDNTFKRLNICSILILLYDWLIINLVFLTGINMNTKNFHIPNNFGKFAIDEV